MAEPLDLRLLELFLSEDADHSKVGHQLCAALGIDLDETLASCADVFMRRRMMAAEHWPEIPDGVAIAETFIVGIAYGYQLALGRLDS